MKSLKQFVTVTAWLALVVSLLFAPVQASAATSGDIQIKFSVAETATMDLGTAQWTLATAWLNAFSSGSGIGQASKVYQDSATLAGSGAITYDLDSTLTGQLGTVSFTRIYMIAVRRTDTPVATTQDENVKIGGDFILTKFLLPGADTLSAVTIPLRPGGVFLYISPDSTGTAITASTGDELTFTNASSADSTTLQVIILGS